MPDVLVAVVKGDGCDPDHIRFAPVADDIAFDQLFVDVAAAGAIATQTQRQLTTALGRITRRQYFNLIGKPIREQRFHQPGQRERFFSQAVDAGLVEQPQRREHRRQRQYRRIRQLSAFGARHRNEVRSHLEPGFLVVSPPAAKSWQLGILTVTLVYENCPNVTRT